MAHYKCIIVRIIMLMTYLKMTIVYNISCVMLMYLPKVDNRVQHVMCHVFQVPDGIDDDSAGDAGRE